MTRSIHLLISICIAFSVFGQPSTSYTLNNKNLTEIEAQYIEVRICNKFLSSDKIIFIDYGQEDNSRRNKILKEPNGNDATFESNMQALNFLVRSGYDLIHAQYFQDSTGSQSENLTLLMKKKLYVPETFPE